MHKQFQCTVKVLCMENIAAMEGDPILENLLWNLSQDGNV